MKVKIIVGFFILIILACFGVAVYFASNTPTGDIMSFIHENTAGEKAEDLIPTPTPTITPTPKFAKLGAHTYTRFPGVLPDAQIKGKKAVIATAKGSIEIELLADESPKTVSNFVYLAKDHYFDGLTFHRVDPGFVVQGGDPAGNGTGGPGYAFEDEPVKRRYMRGIVAMANRGANTNGSQFFFTLADNLPLAPVYNIFGNVVKGMDVVDQIKVGDVMEKVTIGDYTPDTSPAVSAGPASPSP